MIGDGKNDLSIASANNMENPTQELQRASEMLHVLRAQRGESEAFRALVNSYERRLLYFVRRFVDDPDRALDVLQEIWVTVFRRIGTLKAPEAFRVWLYRIARGKAIDHLRDRSREIERIGEPVGDVDAIANTDDSDFVENIGNAELIHKGLAELTALHREVLTLRFIEVMPLEEIAQVVGCSLGTVKSRLHCALQNLREQIRERADA